MLTFTHRHTNSPSVSLLFKPGFKLPVYLIVNIGRTLKYSIYTLSRYISGYVKCTQMIYTEVAVKQCQMLCVYDEVYIHMYILYFHIIQLFENNIFSGE